MLLIGLVSCCLAVKPAVPGTVRRLVRTGGVDGAFSDKLRTSWTKGCHLEASPYVDLAGTRAGVAVLCATALM